MTLAVKKGLIMIVKFSNSQDHDESHEILTSGEVCSILRISMPTLTKYTKQGILRRYGIGNKFYYLKNEVLNSIRQITNKPNEE
jgi:hypothetical protein